MKKLYFAVLVFLFAGKISAQAYFPLLDSVNEWSYTTHIFGVRLNPSVQSGPCSYPVSAFGSSFKEFTTIDTVINSMTYKEVDCTLQSCYLGFIREDTAAKKVYFLDNISSTEKLLYDFSMQVGDTMTINFLAGNGYVSGLYTLDSITNTTVFAGTRRAFHLNCHAQPFSREMLWIESVGNVNDLLYPYFSNDLTSGLYNSCPGYQHDFYQFLICFDHDYKVYFDQCAYTLTQNNPNISTFTDSCDYYSFSGGIRENQQEAGFTVFPNPSNGKSTVSMDVKCAGEFALVIYDATGKQVLKKIRIGNLPEGKAEFEADLSELKNGIYLLELQSAESSSASQIIIQH